MCDYKSGAEQDLLCVRASRLHLRYLPAIAHRRETGGVCLRAMRVCVFQRQRESRAGRMGVRFLCRCTANDKAPSVCPSVSDTEDEALALLVRQVEKSGNVQRWRGVYGYSIVTTYHPPTNLSHSYLYVVLHESYLKMLAQR